MKLIINVCYGEFSVKDEILKQLDIPEETKRRPLRTNQQLINLIESGVDVNRLHSKLCVVEVPDNTTDYMIMEYDGAETVYYVVDGKIHDIF